MIRCAVLFCCAAVFACGDVEADLITRPPQPGVSSGGTASGTGGAAATCASGADCTMNDALYCHPDRLRCVECVTDGHCEESEERCSPTLGECAIPCASDDDCPAQDDPLCDTVIGFCVECRENGDCPTGECRSSECS